MIRDFTFVSVLLLGASLVGLPLAAVLPRTIVNRLLLAPALGLACYGVAVTALYVWGVPTATAGLLVSGVGLIGSASTSRRWIGDLRIRSAGLVISMTAFLLAATLAPAWIGGRAFTAFQGNPYDMLNYEGMAYSYGAYSFDALRHLVIGGDLSRAGSFIVDAYIELGIRPAIGVVASSLYRLLYSNTLEASYPLMAALSTLTWFSLTFFIAECMGTALLLACVVSACCILGFFGQLILDINAWGELAGLPMGVAVFALFVRWTSASASLSGTALGASLPTAVLVAGLLYIYPEITPVYALAILAAALTLIAAARTGRTINRLAIMAAGAVGGLVFCLPFISGTIGSLLGQTSQAANPIGWALFYSGYIFAVPFMHPLGSLTASQLLADAAYVANGLMGAYFVTPSSPLSLGSLVLAALQLTGVTALITCSAVAGWANRRRIEVTQSVIGSVIAVTFSVALFASGRPWEAGKAYTMAFPLLLVLLALPLLVTRRATALAIPACVLLLLQASFAVDRLIISARRDGVGRAAPYPTMASVKRSFLVDPSAWRERLVGCRAISVSVSDAVLDRMTQLFLAQQSTPWSTNNGLRAPFSQTDTYADMVQVADPDCLITDRKEPHSEMRVLNLIRPAIPAGTMIYRGGTVELAASDRDWVDVSGFYGPEAFPNGFARWTDGDGHAYVTVADGQRPGTLTMAMGTISPAGDVLIRLNGHSLYAGPQWTGSRDFTLPKDLAPGAWTIDIVSGTWKAPGDPRSLGVYLTGLALH